MNRSRLISASLLLASAPGLLAASGVLHPLLAFSLMGLGIACTLYFYQNKREDAAAQLRPVRLMANHDKRRRD